MSVRISGLVRFFRRARERLRQGIPFDEQEEFRFNVEEVLFRVEEICAGSGCTPDDLPGPSRNAWRFLEGIDLEDLPEPRMRTLPPERDVRVGGVVSTGRRLAERLWGAHEGARADDFASHADLIEAACEEQAGSPAGLPVRSRRIYAWMRFLANEANLARHVDALDLARSAFDGEGRVHLVHAGVLFRVRGKGRDALVTVSEGFLDASPDHWRAFARLSRREADRADRALLAAYGDSPEYSEVVLELEALVARSGSARGVFHDLDESFERVNASLFGGEIEKPRLTWNDVPTARKFGHYAFALDTVMVALALDEERVPSYVVDFVVFHELLHKKHGMRVVNGRRNTHTPEFRAEERRFPRYEQARRCIDRLAREQRA